MNCKEKVYCGVDVSKLYLDVFFKGRPDRFDNTIKGVESMLARIGKVHYVLESTGGYERMAAWKLMDAGADVSIVNPSRVRHYALSMGQLAKTDPIDAGVIGDFAAAVHPERSEKPTKEQRLLCALVDRRQQLNERKKRANPTYKGAWENLCCNPACTYSGNRNAFPSGNRGAGRPGSL